jgi:hypothetical protein
MSNSKCDVELASVENDGTRAVVVAAAADESDEVENGYYNYNYYHRGNSEDRHPIHARHYCCPAIQSFCVGNIYIAFLSHGCFVIASTCYVKLAYVQLSWLRYALIYNDVPYDVINEDDDATWRSWGQSSYAFDDARARYYDEYATYCIWGATFFVFVGILDYLRYWDTMNAYMIFAGFAGMLSGWSTNDRSMSVMWECVSVHLYLLESYNLINRDHRHSHRDLHRRHDDHHRRHRPDDRPDRRWNDGIGDGNGDGNGDGGGNRTCRWHRVFLIGHLFFLGGCVMDVVGSYLDILGVVGLWVGYSDLVACYLWLGCSIVSLMAELFYLRGQLLTSVTASSSTSTPSAVDDCAMCEIHCY